MARIVRAVVPGACYVGRSLARRDRKRKVKIPKIKYGVPGISPKYSYTTYKTRFNGWTNACLQFIEYKTGKFVIEDDSKKGGGKVPGLEKLPATADNRVLDVNV